MDTRIKKNGQNGKGPFGGPSLLFFTNAEQYSTTLPYETNSCINDRGQTGHSINQIRISNDVRPSNLPQAKLAVSQSGDPYEADEFGSHSAQVLHARAYTYGQDIVFNSGEFS